jgi:hypothetical protein
MVLAWLSPLPAIVALVLFWASIVPNPGGNAPGAAAREQRRQDLNTSVVAVVAACAAGAIMAVMSLCGIRSGRGAWFVVPGAVIGIVLAILVVVVVGLYFLAAGIRV